MNTLITSVISLVIVTVFFFHENHIPSENQNTPIEKTVSETFFYPFNTIEVFEESASMETSASRYFWLNSGAKLIITDGVGSTIIGPLPIDDPWRSAYAKNNPLGTENGLYPQNVFRLLTQSSWKDFEQVLDFSLLDIHAINTRDRDAFSGIFLMSRYVDSNTLYYAGVRMDGNAVIKKKYQGTYYTLAETQVFSSDIPYNRVTFPNLIPTHVWYRMMSRTETTDTGTVRISLFFSKDVFSLPKEVLVATDDGTYFPPIQHQGLAGIRTDYADVQFDNYKLTRLEPSQ
jgi:hypothetical protein